MSEQQKAKTSPPPSPSAPPAKKSLLRIVRGEERDARVKVKNLDSSTLPTCPLVVEMERFADALDRQIEIILKY